jgi:two-component system response regulator YesN
VNILIADDEFYARKALAQIIRDWDSDSHVIEVQNGQEALSVLSTNPIDVVFTDIRMPLLDGLQLSALINEHYPQTSNVIISGYDDFKYAQEAIVYNVKQYILKPLEKKEIISILTEEKSKSNERAIQLKVNKIYSMLHEEDVNSIDENKSIKLPPIHSYRTVVLQTMKYDKFDLIDEMTAEVLSGYPFIYYHLKELRHSHMSIILIAASEQSAADKLWLMGSICDQIYKKVVEVSDDKLSIGISRVHTHLEELSSTYRDAKSALLLRLFHEDIDVYDYTDMKNKGQMHSNLLHDCIHPLYNKVIHNEVKEANLIIAEMMKIIVELQLPVHILNDTCYKLIAIFNAVIESINHKSNESRPYLEPIDLLDYHSPEQIVDFLNDVLVDLSTLIEMTKPQGDRVDELKAYVERNYSLNIKLEELAKNVYYADVSYLSKQFKKRYGISFSQYVIAVRLNHAQRLLEFSPSLSISEIASAVGFNDYSYFIQMYRKHFGATPGMHKRSHKQ